MASTTVSAATVVFGVVLSVFVFVESVSSLPMQQLGMFNMFQFHHGNKIGLSAIDRARRATRVRHHRETHDRHPRNIESMKDLALCKYKVFNDTDELRVPRVIANIRCVEKDDCDCKSKGEATYKCTQLYTKMKVDYYNKDGTKSSEEIDVDYGCVCASESGEQTYKGQAKK